MRLAERLATIVITATLTSAAWVVFGGPLLRQAPVVRSGQGSAPSALLEAPPSSVASKLSAGSLPREAAAPVSAQGWIIPVAGVSRDELTDTFTQSRAGGARVHNAIDIMAPTGTPVFAAAAGRVEKLFLSDEGGKTIYIRSPDGRTISYYAHLDTYAPSLREGATVRQGQVLGTVGYSGNASPEAPHLHFAITRTEAGKAWHEPLVAINPYPLLTAR